jgi:hypothetical protein
VKLDFILCRIAGFLESASPDCAYSCHASIIGLLIPLLPDFSDQVTLLYIISLVIDGDCNKSIFPLIEYTASLVSSDDSRIRVLAVQSLANAVGRNQVIGEFVWQNGVYSEILRLSLESNGQDLPVFLFFFAEFVPLFPDRFSTFDLEHLVNISLAFREHHDSIALLSGIATIERGLRIAVDAGLLDFVMELFFGPLPDKGNFVFTILTRFSLEPEWRFIFESDGFFPTFVRWFDVIEDPCQVIGLKLAYFLHPDFSDAFLASGFVNTVIELGENASFAVSRGICEYLSLAFAEFPAEVIPVLMTSHTLDIFARFLTMDDSQMTLIVIEIMAICCNADPAGFSRIFQESEIMDALEEFNDSEDSLAQQHLSVLIEAIMGSYNDTNE